MAQILCLFPETSTSTLPYFKVQHTAVWRRQLQTFPFGKTSRDLFFQRWLMMGLLGSSRTGFVSPSYLQIRGTCWLRTVSNFWTEFEQARGSELT